MRVHFTLLMLISTTVSGQNLLEQTRLELAEVTTLQQAKSYLEKHKDISGEIIELNARADTAQIDKALISTNVGDLVEFESNDKQYQFIFKTIEINKIKSFRVQYIFLDNKKLRIEQIDSLRSVIFKRLAQGESFEHLASQYSMDSNSQKGGDLGWFYEGMMMREFEDKIRSKRTGEIFTVDIPDANWYYVVRNSHSPRTDKKVVVLYLEIKTGLENSKD